MNRREQELVEQMYRRHGYRCFVTGRPATQRAHIIADTKPCRLIHGDDIIDNPLNWLPAADLAANKKIDIGRILVNQMEVARIIRDEKLTESRKQKKIEDLVRKNIKRKEKKIG